MTSYYFSYSLYFFLFFSFFFFNDTATTEIYTLSLHDALPICRRERNHRRPRGRPPGLCRPDHPRLGRSRGRRPDRKSTRLNSSHSQISYAVFCLKKKKKTKKQSTNNKKNMTQTTTEI